MSKSSGLKILNLYAGIGGNRRLWGAQHKITSVELDPKIAEIYADLYPKDELVIGDAQQYLLNHYKEFDFIWSSPPCQTHSSFRRNIGVRYRGVKPVLPDMSLYQEVIFLREHFEGGWVVENVKPYYRPLIEPTAFIQRHMFWSNFEIPAADFKTDLIRKAQIPQLSKLHKVDLSGYKLPNKRQVLRNCVQGELGLHILSAAK